MPKMLMTKMIRRSHHHLLLFIISFKLFILVLLRKPTSLCLPSRNISKILLSTFHWRFPVSTNNFFGYFCGWNGLYFDYFGLFLYFLAVWRNFWLYLLIYFFWVHLMNIDFANLFYLFSFLLLNLLLLLNISIIIDDHRWNIDLIYLLVISSAWQIELLLI